MVQVGDKKMEIKNIWWWDTYIDCKHLFVCLLGILDNKRAQIFIPNLHH